MLTDPFKGKKRSRDGVSLRDMKRGSARAGNLAISRPTEINFFLFGQSSP